MAFITPGQVSNISKKPITIPTEWVRPSDWPAIIDDANKIQFLVSDIGTQSTGTYSSYSINTIFTRTGSTYSVYIDWGDGSAVSQVSTTTTTTTNHNYNIGGGATCSRGYNTWVITITVDPTVSLTTCGFVPPVNLFSSFYSSSGLLEVYHGDTIGLNVDWTGRFSSAYLFGTYTNLEYVKMPSTWNGTSLSQTFYQCAFLQKVIMPVTMNSCTTMASAFYNCMLLQTLTLPTNCTSLTSMNSAFFQDSSLYSVIFPMTSLAVTDMTSCFSSCSALDNLILPNYTASCNWSTTFNTCYSLTNIRIGSFADATTQTFTQTFNGCYSLVRCDMKDNPAARPNFACNQTFGYSISAARGLTGLANFVFPTCNLVTSMAYAFSGQGSITSIDMSKCSTQATGLPWNNCFTGCLNLVSVTIPKGTGASAPSTFANTFFFCHSLTSVDLSNLTLSSLTSVASMFHFCHNLTSVTFPSESATVLTTMSGIFDSCYSLASVTLPTGLNAVTTMANGFANCTSLKSVVFPATMSALTTTGLASLFSGCRNLESVTLPTTVNTNGITTIANMFQNCVSLQSLTLPTFGTGLTSMNLSFTDTWSLKTIIFNGSMTNAALNFNGTFGRCAYSSANFSAFGSTASIVNGTVMGIQSPFCATYSFSTRFSKLEIQGTSVAVSNGGVRSLRLPAIALTGQWTGSSPQINISYTGIGYADLLLLFNDMAAQGNVTTKTIAITSCTGAASLTAGDRLIITSKGWTITG